MTKVLWTSKDIANYTGGKESEDFDIFGISIDTRTLQKGDLFVPLIDERDGHKFIPEAIKKGAGGTLSINKNSYKTIIVKNTYEALCDIGKAALERSGSLRVAVTGSVGKTSVKDALAQMFSSVGSTHKSLKSYNNKWGVPLTMARMPGSTGYGIFELGMNHAGEISELSLLLKPDIAVITNVGEAHLAQFNNVMEIADAKSEIIDGLTANGILILNNDNEYSSHIANKVKDKKIITFGYSVTSDVLVVSYQCNVDGSNLRLKINKQLIDIYISVPGKHWVENAATCMAVAYAAGIDLRKAATALSSITAQPGRGEQSLININGKNITLIDESYNANVVSTTASINLLGLKSGRLIAVLGDMNELGENELNLHLSLSKPIKEASIDRVILIGKNMHVLKNVLPPQTHSASVKCWEQAIIALKNEIEDGDNILVKGSNSLHLGKLVEALKVGKI